METTNNSGMGFSRRSFLKTMGAAAAFTIAPSSILGKSVSGQNAPSDMVNVCGIGIGSQGGSDIRNIATPDEEIGRGVGYPNTSHHGQYAGLAPKRQGPRMSDQVNQLGAAAEKKTFKYANIYALCDVDTEYAGHMFAGYPKAKQYTDWHDVMDNKEIDAVVIGTPDHNHAIIAANAMLSGKHVFVEKPMAKSIYECRYLTKLAEKTGKVTQMGNQGHNIEGTYQTIEWIKAGLIGDVTEVHMWSNRPMWRQGYFDRPAPEAVPANLNYDLWLGPAAMKSYHSETTHFNWRGLWDYGTGAMGDMGAHTFDAPILALELGIPTKIQATTTPFNKEYIPQSELVKYYFPARGKKPAVEVTWSDGGIKPFRPDELEPGRALRECLYVGKKGMMQHGTHGASPELVPEKPGFKEPAKTMKRHSSVYIDFIESIQGGHKANNDFKIAAKLTEIMLLTNIAVLSQQMNMTLQYDPAKMKITNLPEANQFLHYEYRNGWELPQMQQILPVRQTETGWELI